MNTIGRSEMTNVNSFRTSRRTPALAVLVLAALAAAAFVLWSAPSVHGQDESGTTMTVEFSISDTASVSNKTYTAGADVNEGRLPEATVEFGVDPGKGYYEVVYSATGLPAGLAMTPDRVIRGVPESATNGAVTVTYAANVTFYTADEDGAFSESGTGSADLTFDVTVNPPVTFSAEAQEFFNSRTVTWTPGGSGWTNATFPEAEGGTGTLTYSLKHNASGEPLADHVASVTFDAATRTIGGTVWSGARYAVTFIATDQNGAVAQGYTEVRHEDVQVTVSFGKRSYSINEGSDVNVMVNLSARPHRSVTIPITATGQGGATSADYSGVPASLTFGAAETSKHFTFTATSDAVEDGGESVVLGFGSLPDGVTAGSKPTSTVVIGAVGGL